MRSQGTDVSYQDVSWATLKKLVPYLMNYRRRIFIAMLCLVAAKFASVGMPFILKYIVDALDTANDLTSLIALPVGLLLAYGAVRLFNVLLGEIRDTIFGRVTETAMREIGLKVFRHLHALDLKFHLSRKTGGLSRDIERGTTGISFLLRFMVFNIVPTLLEIILIVGLLSFNYSFIYGLVIIVAVGIYVAYSIYATEIRTRYVRQMNTADSQSNTRAVDSLLNYETVKYFTNEEHEADNYDKELEVWQGARRNNRLSVFALNGGQAFIISLAMTIAMVVAAQSVVNKSMSLGDFVLINAFMMQIFMPLNFLGFVYREMKGSMANIEKMFSLLDEKSAIQEINDAQNLEYLIKEKSTFDIKFDQVDFRYEKDRPIIKNCSINIPYKSKVAIVGSSGSGKSTLAKLLFRFYDVDSGSISIGNENIQNLTLKSLRNCIGVVPQDTMLFNTSIYENVKYGCIDATDDEIKSAIKKAHLSSFIDSLPQGWETMVGERGLKLSGGEKQRISIARTILKNPPILIFDEATSSLDSHSEREILTAIDEISGQRTSLVIAHRLSTISNADKIIVFDQGNIVEQGTHSYLLNLKGRYAHLWNIQQKQKQEEQ